jgi:hypothetical protein
MPDDSKSTLNSVAETIGSAFGSVAASVDSVREQHPHPVDEAREAVAAGQVKLVQAAVRARRRAAAVAKITSTAAGKSREAGARTRKKVVKVVAKAKRKAKRQAKRTERETKRRVKRTIRRVKRAVRRGQRAVKRAGRRS